MELHKDVESVLVSEQEIKDIVNALADKINIDYGVYLLSLLKNRYNDESVALCAYNAGIGAVDKWLSNPEYSDDKKTLKEIPYKETKNYVFRVLKSKEKYKNLYFRN